MTAAEKIEWQKKALKVMKDHCAKTIGWPTCTNEAIFRELHGMWEALQANGLVLDGMTFQAFVSHAHNKYLQAEMNRILGL
jgi:hypothetical protein